jgi:hypothetical protein
MHTEYWWENQKGKDHYKNQDICRRIILKWILPQKDGVVWAGLIWFGIGTGGGLL